MKKTAPLINELLAAGKDENSPEHSCWSHSAFTSN